MPDNVIYLSLDFLGIRFHKICRGDKSSRIIIFFFIFRDSQFFGQFIHIRKARKERIHNNLLIIKHIFRILKHSGTV